MDSMHEHDEWLMAQVRRGRREPLELLVRRYASPLLTFIRRMVGDVHRSEELFQEVFLTVWTKRRQYEFPRPFKAWLFAIAANQCRGWFRQRRPDRAALAEDADPEELGPSPPESAIATETASLVAHAVGRLPTQQRLVVVMRVWDGLSYAEIADALGRSEGTVRANMHHALAALRKLLEPRLGERSA